VTHLVALAGEPGGGDRRPKGIKPNTQEPAMKPRPQAALLCSAVLSLALTATAGAHAQATTASGQATTGVVQRVADAVERGAQAAARGIERGAKAAEHGIRVGVQATARGIERGAQAAAQAAATVAKKVDTSPGPPVRPAPAVPATDQAGAASRT